MRTEKQIAASRLNGWKSNGATTAEGKARIVAANLKPGVYTESEILSWEDPESLERLEAGITTTTAPGTSRRPPAPTPGPSKSFPRNALTRPWESP